MYLQRRKRKIKPSFPATIIIKLTFLLTFDIAKLEWKSYPPTSRKPQGPPPFKVMFRCKLIPTALEAFSQPGPRDTLLLFFLLKLIMIIYALNLCRAILQCKSTQNISLTLHLMFDDN